MDLVVVDARAKETARAGRLAQAHGAVIEKSTQRAATRATGDPHDGRVFIRCLGQRDAVPEERGRLDDALI